MNNIEIFLTDIYSYIVGSFGGKQIHLAEVIALLIVGA